MEMRKKVIESSVLFLSVSKWIFLASCIGAIVGLSTSIFLKSLGFGIDLADKFEYYYLLLPLAFLASHWIVKYLAPEAEGHGTERVIEAVHRRSGKIDPLVVPVKLLATVVTISLGGSAGKEGPCAQIGAGLSSWFADIFRFDDKDRKKLVICGISAGFATVFGTPIAGAIFGVEVLFVGGLLYEVLLPSFVAGIVGFQASSALGVTYFHEPLNFIPQFSSFFFLKVCLGGVFFGLCSFALVESLSYGKRLMEKIDMPMSYKAIAGGALLVALSVIFSTRYLGLGLDTIHQSLEGHPVPALSFILKMLFTSITLNFGGSGGIVTPIFFVGATAGNAFGSALNLDLQVFSAIGMVSLLAGAANTPISASIMAVEIFGPQVAPYAAVACVISFLMTGHRSVYPSQILSLVKSSSLRTEGEGKEMRDAGDTELRVRSKSLLGQMEIARRRMVRGKHKPPKK